MRGHCEDSRDRVILTSPHPGEWVVVNKFHHQNRTRLTLAGPTPTNISRNSDPLTVMKGTLASPAVALASSVLPVPGGPVRMAPFRHREITSNQNLENRNCTPIIIPKGTSDSKS